MKSRTSPRARFSISCLSAALLCCSSASPPAKSAKPEWGERAAAVCRERGEPQGAPSRRFESDVCSLFFDGSWGDCCVEHDMLYWCGGTRSDRSRADRELRECVSARVSGWRGASLGRLMEAGTFLGGSPWLPSPWRWGYGHAYPSGYATASGD